METRGDRHVFNSKRCRASSFHRTAAMHHKTRAKVADLNEHFVCALCRGYLIDATTITECLHSFCKTCIVRYLATCNYCPVCDVQVHKTRPLQCVRQDKILQDLVYKLIPGLFQDEMTRRRSFYIRNPIEGAVIRSGGDEVENDDLSTQERVIFSKDEHISLALQLSTNGRPPGYSKNNDAATRKSSNEQRYLLCPAGVTIGHLKKFVRLKFSLPHKFKVDMYHSDECLNDAYTLMDIAYIYTWRRHGPLKLFFTVYESILVKRKAPNIDVNANSAKTPKDKTSSSAANAREPKIPPNVECRDWTTKSVVRSQKTSEPLFVATNNEDAITIDCSSDDQSPFRDVSIPIVETTPPASTTPCSSRDGNDGQDGGGEFEDGPFNSPTSISHPPGPVISQNSDIAKSSQTDVKVEPLELLRVPVL